MGLFSVFHKLNSLAFCKIYTWMKNFKNADVAEKKKQNKTNIDPPL